MLASIAASLPPPLRRFPPGARLTVTHVGVAGPLLPRQPRRRAFVCRADLQQDAPFAAAIGACVLASLAFPPRRPREEAVDEEEEEEEEGVFGATDTRMAVMGIISLLPYFNWLLEAAVSSGDIESFKLVEKAWNLVFPSAAKEKDARHGNKRNSVRTDRRSNKRIPSAHESRERLRNSDIFKRRLDDPVDEKRKKSDRD